MYISPIPFFIRWGRAAFLRVRVVLNSQSRDWASIEP